MSTDRPIPYGEIVDYSHVDEDGVTYLEIADLVTPPLTQDAIQQRIAERKARGDAE